MSQTLMFYVGLTVSVLAGLSVVLYLQKPLFKILTDVCGTEDRARFWVQITNLSFMLMTLLMALGYRPAEIIDPNLIITGHLQRTLAGLLIVTFFLAMTISIFTLFNGPKTNVSTK